MIGDFGMWGCDGRGGEGRGAAPAGGDLALRLGRRGGGQEEPVVRPGKRVRVAAGGHGGGPSCQVDGCEADLNRAKDYHRRHKVCGEHSKAPKAAVGGTMQRFCQQCSRFHLLLEFDEGKRSCRRRLAGHNERRRKIQPEEHVPHLVLTGNQHNGLENPEIIKMLTELTQLQGKNVEKASSSFQVPGRDQLVQILKKMNPSDDSTSVQLVNTNAPQARQLLELLTDNNEKQTPLTLDLISVLSSAQKTSDTVSIAASPLVNSESGDDDSAKKSFTELSSVSSDDYYTASVPTVVPDLDNLGINFSVEAAKFPVHSTRTLQLFGHSGNESLNMQSSECYMFSATSSRPMFSSNGCLRQIPLESAVHGSNFCDNTSRHMVRNGDSHVIEILPSQKEFPSTVFDPQPSTHDYDSQARTDRITFKLFNDDPGTFPTSIRKKILDWLSLSPSDMEIHMRPGCVILTIYLSMTSMEWDKLYVELLPRAELLLQGSDSNFWRSSNFLIHFKEQILSHNEGKIHLLKYDKRCSPELLLVLPLAIVSGMESTLVLRGRNLRSPGTKIHCTNMGGYTSKEANSWGVTDDDDSCSEQFVIPERSADTFGRCFLEVENDLRGNTFPVIIADDSICKELRMLETELQDVGCVPDLEYRDQDVGRSSREDILQFLNELGWLFQRHTNQSDLLFKYFSCSRFQALLLFALERDWSFIVKKILDIVVDINSEREDLSRQYLEALGEIHPLHRAVRRKNRKMVDMLLTYLIDSGSSSRMYFFFPDITGPGGVTPLHIAASMDDSEEMVDALTNDPQEIGLKCWNSLLDHSSMSPYAYAKLRNHDSYNILVRRKVAEREHSQMSKTSEEEDSILSDTLQEQKPDLGSTSSIWPLSCTQCAFQNVLVNGQLSRIAYHKGMIYRPYIHSLLAIATVCMCVSVFLRGAPELCSVAPFKWEVIGFGIM